MGLRCGKETEPEKISLVGGGRCLLVRRCGNNGHPVPWLDKTWGLKLSIILPVRLAVAIVLLAIGIPMVFWTITRFLMTKGSPIPFNPPPALVVNGLYRIVRNPMHLGWTIVLLGLAILMQSFTLLVIFIPLFLLVHIIYLKFVEEKELEKKFGQAYLDYKKRVPMFIPKLRRN